MSQTLDQIFIANPSTTMLSTDLLYLVHSPFTPGTDSAITWANMAASSATINGTVNAGTINQLAWYAATGNAVSGLSTANNGLLVTSATGVPSIGNTVTGNIAISTNSDTYLNVVSTSATGQPYVNFLRNTSTQIGAIQAGTNSTGGASGSGLLYYNGISNGPHYFYSVTAGNFATLDPAGSTIAAGNLTLNTGEFHVGTSAGGGAQVIDIFSPTASKGLMQLLMNDNGGNFFTRIQNAAMGQNTIFTLPDPVSASTTFLVGTAGATQHITAFSLQVDAGALITGQSTGGANSGLIVYSSTASKGNLNLYCVDNVGNYGHQLINASCTAARTWTLPDATGTLALTSSSAQTFSTDSGSATPSAGTITISGSSTGLTTTGSGSTVGMTGTLAIGHGGTAVTSVTTSPTASSFAGWDANKNLSANNVLEGYTTTATAAGTTTLTVASTYFQFFTGSTTQTVVLPVTSTLVLGQSFYIINNSSGVVTVQSSGANTIQAMAANTALMVTCILTSGTTAASWNAIYNIETALTLPLSIANGGTAVSSVTTAPAATSWAGWDANKNLSANTFLAGYTTTATAAGTTTLTVSSTQNQAFTGSTTQTVVLPVVATLANGHAFKITNASTGVVTVQSSGANNILAMVGTSSAVFTFNSTAGTGTASWTVDNPSNAATVDVTSNTSSVNYVIPFVTGAGSNLQLLTGGNLLYNPNNTSLFLTAGSGGSIGSPQFRVLGSSSGAVFINPPSSSFSNVTYAFLAAPGTPAANSLAALDANKNITANNFFSAYATFTTSQTLTVASTYSIYMTGSTAAQTMTLPVVSNYVSTGAMFMFMNNSTQSWAINSSGGNLVATLPSNAMVIVQCILITGTTAASWNAMPITYITTSGTGNVALLQQAPTINQANLVGTTTNDNAAAGSVGELLSTVVLAASAVALTTATAANIATLSLTAGDWDVWGSVWTNPAAGTITTKVQAAISQTTGTLPTTPDLGTSLSVLTGITTAATESVTLQTGATRISLASTTTVYLVASVTFSVSTLGGYGAIYARRRR